MKKLLSKELKLTASPLSFIFIAFSLMAFIPRYPILLGAFFVCFGIFQSYQKGREANDTLYTALLPIKKKHVVKAKFVFATFIQMVAFVLFSLFTLIRVLFMSNLEPYQGNTLMNANLVYLAFILIIFAAFNLTFINGFFKTAYKIGVPFLAFAISVVVVVGIGEVLHHIPSLEVLNSNYHYSHIIALVIGVLIYVLGTICAYVNSQNNFEKIDL